MGMFDNIKCAMVPAGEYQTKDTPVQYLDNYEIRADGSLWRRNASSASGGSES